MGALAPLAVSVGDPAGVGPELIAEAWLQREAEGLPAFFAVGGAALLQQAAASRGHTIAVKKVATAEQALPTFAGALPVLGADDMPFDPGKPDIEGARFALGSLSRATQLARSGQAAALVTGPIAKSRLAAAGFEQPGQTEFVADACKMDREEAVMMLAGPSLRTVPITVHCALADVPDQLSSALIVRRARIVSQALTADFGIARPRLAICGLNPHAGEDGRFGDEESRIIGPAIEALHAEGLDVAGPYPADSLFAPHSRTGFDAALCMYHDQALIPVKALDFDRAVNITLGLPVVRTSPDHGTAFAIAGKAQADPGAMIAAIRMAGDCAARRALA